MVLQALAGGVSGFLANIADVLLSLGTTSAGLQAGRRIGLEPEIALVIALAAAALLLGHRSRRKDPRRRGRRLGT
jgi:hypothetical protein